MAAFYGLYSLIRDLRGTKPVSHFQALTNAHRIIGFERTIGIFHEISFQHWFLSSRWLIRLCDDYYGSTHFIVTIGVLVFLFFWHPSQYRLWRNVLAFTTGLALVGFYFFPLMPPRLLPDPPYQFVDTLRVVGGLWSFSSGPANSLSNQYAAMPSLHTAWAAWCALAVASLLRPWWAKALTALYPAFTIFAVTVTANHYFSDCGAGLLLLGISYLIAQRWTRRVDKLVRSRA